MAQPSTWQFGFLGQSSAWISTFMPRLVSDPFAAREIAADELSAPFGAAWAAAGTIACDGAADGEGREDTAWFGSASVLASKVGGVASVLTCKVGGAEGGTATWGAGSGSGAGGAESGAWRDDGSGATGGAGAGGKRAAGSAAGCAAAEAGRCGAGAGGFGGLATAPAAPGAAGAARGTPGPAFARWAFCSPSTVLNSTSGPRT
mmetsp:Transcript_5578/g.11660  ORF Transcript_5578/g.11660 Transcript_5578/m.11660 type:complete len:204 (-) Transcript_5578:262-873(-)